jgi:ribosome recycling factor
MAGCWLAGWLADRQVARPLFFRPLVLFCVTPVSPYKSNALSAVAQVTLKLPKLLQVAVFDPQMLEPVRAAVEQSGMDLNPSLEGGSLMVPVPNASKETRSSTPRNARSCVKRHAITSTTCAATP